MDATATTTAPDPTSNGFWEDTTAVLGVFLVIPLVLLIGGLIYTIVRINRNRSSRDLETKVYRLDAQGDPLDFDDDDNDGSGGSFLSDE